MTYERINFKDQSVERPRTYEMTHNADGSITLTDSFGLVNELGTPINADTMNHIEDGIDSKQDQLIAGDNIILENNVISAKSGAMPIGTIIPVNASSNYVPDGTLPCDGTEYTREQFKDFCQNYLDGEGLLDTCTYTQYEEQIATYGQCSKFAVVGTSTIKTSGLSNITVSHLILNLYPNGVELEFTYNGTNWTLDGNVVNLADYHITASGTYKAGDTFRVNAGLVQRFRVPLIKDRAVIQQALSDSELGKSYNANIAISNTLWTGNSVKPSKSSAGEANSLIVASGVVEGTETLESLNYTDLQIANINDFTNNAVALRYFVVVANGQTNQSMMDWSAWASSLQGKANVDLSNVQSSQAFKDNVIDWSVPDYTAPVSLVDPAVAPSAGLMIFNTKIATDKSITLTINGTTATYKASYTEELYVPFNVSEGDTFSCSQSCSYTFYPFKGVS